MNKVDVDGRQCECSDWCCSLSNEFLTRRQIRAKYGITEDSFQCACGKEADCGICLLWCCLGPCFTCQDRREIRIRRNFDAQNAAPQAVQMTTGPR